MNVFNITGIASVETAGITGGPVIPNGPIPIKRQRPLSLLIQSFFRSFFLFALLLAVLLLLRHSSIPGMIGLGDPFDAFPDRIPAAIGFSDAFTFLKEVPFVRVSKLEKWKAPIKVRVEGKYNNADLEALQNIADRFNTVKGFPGISIVDSGENVLVSYIARSEFETYRAKYKAEADNQSFCIHYTTNGVITKGAIVLINETDRGLQDAVALHEFFHLVGFFDHTSLRDSILNEVGPVPSLSPTDLLAFRMLYDPKVPVLATYADLQKTFAGAELRQYLVPSAPLVPDDALPDLTLPLLIAGFVLLVSFLARLRRFGFPLSLGVLGVSLLACVSVSTLYYSYYPQIMEAFYRLKLFF